MSPDPGPDFIHRVRNRVRILFVFESGSGSGFNQVYPGPRPGPDSTNTLQGPYKVKSLKNLLLRKKRLMTLKFGIQHRVLKYDPICSNGDTSLTLTIVMTR